MNTQFLAPAFLGQAGVGASMESVGTQVVQALPAVPVIPTPAGGLEMLAERLPATGDLIRMCEHMNSGVAALLIVGGLICLLWGFQFFRWLVPINAAVLGAYAGVLIGTPYDAALPSAIVGGFVAAAITWPTLKYAVAIMGIVLGAVVGAGLWQTFGLDPRFAWSGAGMGMIAFGMLSFILFRGSIVMYTSLQGSLMLIVGILAMIFKWEQVAPVVSERMTLTPFLLPMIVLFATVAGMIYQHTANAPAGAPPAKK